MTTIAWDGATLAADTRVTAGGLPRNTHKIFRLANGDLYGGCGTAQDSAAARKWLESGGEKPELTDFAAILINAEGCWLYEHTLYPYKLEDKFTAIGSGRDFAIAAMHYGKSAVEAVQLAMKYDVYTGGLVESIAMQ